MISKVIMSKIIEQLRGPKIGGIAIFDLGGSIVIALMIAQKMKVSKIKTVICIIALGEVVHVALGVNTPVTRRLTRNAV